MHTAIYKCYNDKETLYVIGASDEQGATPDKIFPIACYNRNDEAMGEDGICNVNISFLKGEKNLLLALSVTGTNHYRVLEVNPQACSNIERLVAESFYNAIKIYPLRLHWRRIANVCAKF